MKLVDTARVAFGLARAMRSQYWSVQRIRSTQERALVAMMRYAVTRVPFYRDLGIPLAQINQAADLERFPVIAKADIQREGQRLLADGFAPTELFSSRTSGSSGQPTITWFDRDSWLQTRYVMKLRRLIATAGVRPGMRVLIVSEGRTEELVALSRAAPGGGGVVQQRFVSIHEPIEQHLALLNEFRPSVLYAYPSYLVDLIAASDARDMPLPPVPVIYTSSEVLTSGARQEIESAFAGRVHDVYGSTEMKEVAWQCDQGRYHVNFETTWIEPLSSENPDALILSTLCNRAMPLLRFRIGDLAVGWQGANCSCGRHAPALVAIHGRQGDTVVLADGRRLSPYLLTTVIETDPALLQYRIVETDTGRFRIDLVVRPGSTDSRTDSQLCAQLREVAGAGCDFSVRRVERLERSRSGKRSVFLRERADLTGERA